MVAGLRFRINKCFKCSSGLQMPNGDCWCSIDVKPHEACSYVFNSGLPKVYKSKPREILPIQKIKQIKQDNIKPKIVKPKVATKNITRKNNVGQKRLF